ncbi:uncharacterized protein ASCRUDRAFT_7354 [Ascoidea rubescens DSM 1968]|uniref:Uncharacterized protein n=1 Tax=Ascoidea rubescens DSM 1968 TaxID=1344418 RepID=A0A1D2VK42_9ASCO|nr:hypothetical protein ASCRUDRAFT_7354 [Ascoidea rubescens DSM 1968]ODV61887.1 hypothetical protein ASCRUDRAFT_7354 [Ascoidea rubescens DSM 1968]
MALIHKFLNYSEEQLKRMMRILTSNYFEFTSKVPKDTNNSPQRFIQQSLFYKSSCLVSIEAEDISNTGNHIGCLKIVNYDNNNTEINHTPLSSLDKADYATIKHFPLLTFSHLTVVNHRA